MGQITTEFITYLTGQVKYFQEELKDIDAALARRAQLETSIATTGPVDEAKEKLRRAADYFHEAVDIGDKEIVNDAQTELDKAREQLRLAENAKEALATFDTRRAIKHTLGSQLAVAKTACERDLVTYTQRLEKANKQLEAEEAKKQRENRVKVLAVELKKLESAQYSYGVVPARTSKIRDIRRELRELGVNHAQRSSVREVAATARARA